MPRMASADGGIGGGGGGGKKKFGKNLNKLIKPAAPPIPQTVGGNQRNGLLLLSAQKKSSGGLLSAKPSSAAAPPASTPVHQPSTKAYEPSTVSTHDALLSAVTGKTERDANHAPDAWGVAAAEKSHQQQQQQQQQEQEQSTAVKAATEEATTTTTTETTPAGPSWDDYGGRGPVTTTATVLDSNTANNDTTDQDQVQYMSRLARERSARARAEEDERMAQQRERAAARLRELDEKRQQERDESTSSPEGPQSSSPPPAPTRGWDRTRSGTRALWEPSQKLLQRKESEPKLQTIPAAISVTTTSTATADPQPASASATTDEQQQQQQPVIHLSSYEDRDRGERQNSAAPRMLYDPKSGSMVAVKERDEKKKVRGRKSRKERAASKQQQQDAKNASEAADSSGSATGRVPKNSFKTKVGQVQVAVFKKSKMRTRSRLPRTCGVLYERDDKGQFRCVDGCEGDLGYGCHSVAGGRALNPEAYQDYLAVQEEVAMNNGVDVAAAESYVVGAGVYGGMYGGAGSTVYSLDGGAGDGVGELGLQTGFMLNEEAEEEPEPEPMELVTADDKLELVGMDDSPTLKPTAKEWAPSQAAIAAAEAAAQKRGSSDEEGEDPVLEESESDGDETGSFGLGFDPQNMTGLIQSPPNPVDESANLVASVDLDSLKLDPPMFSAEATKTETSGPGHIFAFGSSGTWGTKTGTESSSGDWGMAGSSTGGLFGSVDSTFVSSSSKSSTHSNPFINLPATGTSTWGAPTGLGGLTLNGDNKATTGD